MKYVFFFLLIITFANAFAGPVLRMPPDEGGGSGGSYKSPDIKAAIAGKIEPRLSEGGLYEKSDTGAGIPARDVASKSFDTPMSSSHLLRQPWSPTLVQFLVISVLSFSCVALIMATALLWHIKAPAHQVLRIFGIISILGFSALLLVVGYSNEQLTPIVGLFGAIAGYLLGKDSKSENADKLGSTSQ